MTFATKNIVTAAVLLLDGEKMTEIKLDGRLATMVFENIPDGFLENSLKERKCDPYKIYDTVREVSRLIKTMAG